MYLFQYTSNLPPVVIADKICFTQAKELYSMDKPGQHPRELNPFWREGGTGLPQERDHSSQVSKSAVGDGGRSWILRSYKRALEQAEAENKSFEDIAVKRWGSLEKLYTLLQSAGIDPSNPDCSVSKKHDYSSHSKGRKVEERKKSHTHLHKESVRNPEGKANLFLKPGEGGDRPGSRYKQESKNWQILSGESGKTESHSLTSVECKEDVVMKNLSSVSEGSLQPVTDAQLNTLGAKLVKAEMFGDVEKIERLKSELNQLRELKKSQDSKKSVPREKEEKATVVLTETDRFGRERPFEFSRHAPQRPGSSTGSSHSKKGRREKYFADDDRYSLQDLVEQERKMTREETHAAIARMSSKFVPAANSDETIDDVLDSKAALHFDEAKELEKQKQRAMLESRAMAEILSKCQFCLDSPSFNKHLLIAAGIGVYLAVPSHQSITEGHCLLVPIEHTTCSLQMDENVWSEIRVFQKGLTRMFADRDMDVIFTEIYSHSKRRSHMYIECIPLPKDEGSLAPMYFKKAILESDEEWAQNAKLIDTRSKGVRNCIPTGLPYFFVDFGLGGGYAHVIEDATKFPHYFAKEVVGGLLDVEPRLWLKPPKESIENQKSKALKVSSWWNPYDWTEKLKR